MTALMDDDSIRAQTLFKSDSLNGSLRTFSTVSTPATCILGSDNSTSKSKSAMVLAVLSNIRGTGWSSDKNLRGRHSEAGMKEGTNFPRGKNRIG